MSDNDIDPKAFHEELSGSEYGAALVCDNDGVYPNSMGRAAQRYFGIESD